VIEFHFSYLKQSLPMMLQPYSFRGFLSCRLWNVLVKTNSRNLWMSDQTLFEFLVSQGKQREGTHLYVTGGVLNRVW